MKIKSNKNNLKTITIISIIIIAIIAISSTIAYFTISFEVEELASSAEFKYDSTNTFTASNTWLPGDTDNPTLTVTNTGNIPIVIRASITETWEDGSNNTLPNTSNGVESVLKQIGSNWKKVGSYYYYNGTLAPNTTTPTSLITQVTFNPAISSNTCTQDPNNTDKVICDKSGIYANATYTITVNYEVLQSTAIEDEWGLQVADINTGIPSILYNYMKLLSVSDTTSSTYVTSSTGVNFGSISSDTNGKGIYDHGNGVYYYRGDISNNNVYFAGYCWKIIRTTSTGGVKLIYNGTGTSSSCTGTSPIIGLSSYNSSDNDIKYAGYMYSDGTTENSIDSTIKTVVDNWYQSNLTSYTSYLEDTPFYNERNIASTGGNTVVTGLAPANRIWGFSNTSGAWGNATSTAQIANTTVSLNATRNEDKFTVSSELGNGALTYPIGLITSDEVIMAGGRGYGYGIDSQDVYGANRNYYLVVQYWYWTMSPFGIKDDSKTYLITLFNNGALYHGQSGNDPGGVRPVISLKAGTRISGGNGTSASPFTIQSN